MFSFSSYIFLIRSSHSIRWDCGLAKNVNYEKKNSFSEPISFNRDIILCGDFLEIIDTIFNVKNNLIEKKSYH